MLEGETIPREPLRPFFIRSYLDPPDKDYMLSPNFHHPFPKLAIQLHKSLVSHHLRMCKHICDPLVAITKLILELTQGIYK